MMWKLGRLMHLQRDRDAVHTALRGPLDTIKEEIYARKKELENR